AYVFIVLGVLGQVASWGGGDAALAVLDIDCIAMSSVNSTMWSMSVIEHLGIRPTYIDGTMVGGSSFVAHLLAAAQALHSGQCNAVLVCYGSTQRTATMDRAATGAARQQLDPQPFEAPYQPLSPISSYALAAARHMAEFGTTREHLAEVALAARRWAQLNPEAYRRDPLTLEEVLESRMISDPLKVLDCCLVTDGAGAYVLVRADRAKDLPQPPIYLLGNATAV